MTKKLMAVALFALVLTQSCYRDEVAIENIAPSDFSVVAMASTNQIELDWTDATDPEKKQITYEIKKDGAIVAISLSATAFSLKNLDPDTEYQITVTAIDADGMRTEVKKKVRTDVYITPSPFQIAQSGKTVNTITISWDASTAKDGSAITYDIYLNDKVVASNISQLAYTFEGLKGATWHTAKVLAKTRNKTSLMQTLRVSTDGNTVVFGAPNHPVGRPIAEADYGIIEIPVIVRDFPNQNHAEALEEIQFGFSIDGTVNKWDYKLLTPSPLVIAKGATMGTIKVSIIADDFQEFTNESLIIAPGKVENAEYSNSPKPGIAISNPKFILNGLGNLLSDEVRDAYVADISWSHPDAYVSATLYKETATPGVFSSVSFFDSGRHPQSFELATSRPDGNYYLEIERKDTVKESVEVNIYIAAPDDPNKNFKTLTAIENRVLATSSTRKIVLDIVINGGVYTFKKRD